MSSEHTDSQRIVSNIKTSTPLYRSGVDVLKHINRFGINKVIVT